MDKDRRIKPGTVLDRSNYSFEKWNTIRRNPYTYGVPEEPTTPLVDNKLAKEIQTLRKSLSLTQREFGEKTGVAPLTVSFWERGKLNPSRSAMILMEQLKNSSGQN